MKHHTKEERLIFLNEWESSGKTAETFSAEHGVAARINLAGIRKYSDIKI